MLHLVAEEGRRGGGQEEGARGEAVPDRTGRLAIALALSWYVRAASPPPPSSSSSFAVREFFFLSPDAGAAPFLGRRGGLLVRSRRSR